MQLRLPNPKTVKKKIHNILVCPTHGEVVVVDNVQLGCGVHDTGIKNGGGSQEQNILVGT